MPNQETELLIDDPHLLEHFKSGELTPDPEYIEADPQGLAINGLKGMVSKYITARKVAVATVGFSLVTAGVITGARRTAHS
jgi:hypothetical protein